MNGNTRREFLADVGRGMLLGSIGAALAGDLDVATPIDAGQDDPRLTFGDMEPLVAFMQDTPLDALQRKVIAKIQSGTKLGTLTAAAALANARTFAGQDYIGFHTFMALSPALAMAGELPARLQPLPVLKVLYRNTQRIHDFGGRSHEVLQPLAATRTVSSDRVAGEVVRDAVRRVDWTDAEQRFASLASEPPGEMFNHVQYAVQDSADVHRVVLAWRAWLAVDLVGRQHAHTLLRQSVRYCLRVEENMRGKPDVGEVTAIRALLPSLLDQYHLQGQPLGTRAGDDQWIEELATTIFASNRAQSADAVAQALSEGFSPESVGEAMSIAANLLLLHDPGRRRAGQGDKDIGSVHGDSVGVHACDAANAWRNIARVSNPRNTVASLIVGGFHTAGQRKFVADDRWPLDFDSVAKIDDPAELLRKAETAIQDRNQSLAGAAVHRYGRLNGSPRPVFDLLLRYSTTEDGALHAEKFYRTVTEEFAATRESLRWRHLTGLARVTASEFGRKSPGYEEACALLKLDG